MNKVVYFLTPHTKHDIQSINDLGYIVANDRPKRSVDYKRVMDIILEFLQETETKSTLSTIQDLQIYINDHIPTDDPSRGTALNKIEKALRDIAHKDIY